MSSAERSTPRAYQGLTIDAHVAERVENYLLVL